MTSPYSVPLDALDPREVETVAEGPGEPDGAIPPPLPARARVGEGPFDPALPVNALGS